MKKITIVLICLFIFFSITGLCQDDVNPFFESEEMITNSLYLKSSVYYNENLKSDKVNTLKYVPFLDVSPNVFVGENISGGTTFDELENTSAVAGVSVKGNVLVKDGKIISYNDSKTAFGFYSDTSAFAGSTGLELLLSQANGDGGKIFETGIVYNNKPTYDKIVLTDSNFSSNTNSDYIACEIVVSVEGEFKVGNTVFLTVEEAVEGTQNTAVEKGKAVITVAETSEFYSNFTALKSGDVLSLSIKGNDEFKNVVNAVEAQSILVDDFKSVAPVETAEQKLRDARNVAGILEDGSVVFVNVCGEREDYAGMTLEETAEYLVGLGVKKAVELDSTQNSLIGVKLLGKTSFDVSDKSLPLSSLIVFQNISENSFTPEIVDFPFDYFILAGSKIKLKPDFYTGNGNKSFSQPTNFEYTCLTGADISDGIYSAKEGLYTDKISGVFTFGQLKISKDVSLFITDKIDAFKLDKNTVVVEAGDSFSPEFTAWYKNVEVRGSADVLNCEVLSGGEYIIIKDGVITAKNAPLFTNVKVKVSYGEFSDILTVMFGRPAEIIDGFDTGDFSNIMYSSVMGQTSGFHTEKAIVTSTGSVSYIAPVTLEEVPEYFTLYVKKGYSGSLYMIIRDEDGKDELIPYYVYKDYSALNGWVQLLAPLTEYHGKSIKVVAALTTPTIQTITADDLTAFYGSETLPFEDISTSWAKDYVTKAYDMGLVNGYREEGRFIFKPDKFITRAEFAKMLSSYLNLDLKFYFDYGKDFADKDLIPEWAAPYVKLVSVEGYMNGSLNADGSVTFNAQSYITRAEAMVVFAKLFEIETLPETLDFSDASTIPAWAKDSVLKTVSSGIITGFDDGTLRVNENITRAQMCVMFTRLWDMKK